LRSEELELRARAGETLSDSDDLLLQQLWDMVAEAGFDGDANQ